MALLQSCISFPLPSNLEHFSVLFFFIPHVLSTDFIQKSEPEIPFLTGNKVLNTIFSRPILILNLSIIQCRVGYTP